MADTDALTVTYMPVGELHTYHRNPRQGATALIAKSLRVHGQYKPITVNGGTHTGRPNEVLAGNHTLIAARDEGWAQIAVAWVDVDDDEAARIVADDNHTSDLASNDQRLLAELLSELPDLDDTTFDPGDLDQLLKNLKAAEGPLEGDTDPDEAPEPPAEPTCAVGDLWHLGSHRLIVGDATDTGTWDSLLDGERVDLIWTDPPYGVSYVGKTKDALTIQNDSMNDVDLADFLRAVLSLASSHCAPGAAWYVASPAGPLHLQFATVLADLEVWRQTLIWVKDQFVMGRSDYHYRHEPIIYGWVPGETHHPPGDRGQDTVFDIARPRASAEHPTMKPVELIEAHITNSSEPDALVVDPFAGSGSTLIAAHRNHRRAALIEVDPRYGDVVCRRFQQHTGIMPMRDGVEVDFTAEAAKTEAVA